MKGTKTNDISVITDIKGVLNEVYLDWMCNFETIDAYASWYGIDEKEARAIIDMGRKIHEKYFVKEENNGKKK